MSNGNGISKQEAFSLFGAAGYTVSYSNGIITVHIEKASDVSKVKKYAKVIDYKSSLAITTRKAAENDNT